jgi:hypothetical protein
MNGKPLTPMQRIIALETKMEMLLNLNKWQLGVLSAIFVTVLGAVSTMVIHR